MERFQRSLRRLDGDGGATEEELVSDLNGTIRALDAEIATLEGLLAKHGVGRGMSFIKPRKHLVCSPSATVRVMIDALARFDRWVECASFAHLSGLLEGAAMDSQLDGYVTRMQSHARNGG